MDDITFTLVSTLFAFGGFLGTAVGYKKLLDQRQTEKNHENYKKHEQTIVDPFTNLESMHTNFTNKSLLVVNDFSKIITTLSIHSLYGAIVYPLSPLYLFPALIKKNLNRKKL